LPKPITPNNYDKLACKISEVAKIVVEDTMADVAKEVREQCKGRPLPTKPLLRNQTREKNRLD